MKHQFKVKTNSFLRARYSVESKMPARTGSSSTKRNRRCICSRRDYHQVDEQDPYLPPSAASQAIAARTLRGQGSYPPTAPPLNSNALGTHNTIKQPLLLTPPPPSYATATARARQLHESMLKFVHETFSFILLRFI